jgi:hypothetical protein
MTGEIVEQTERLRPSRTFFARLQTESTDVILLAWAACRPHVPAPDAEHARHLSAHALLVVVACIAFQSTRVAIRTPGVWSRTFLALARSLVCCGQDPGVPALDATHIRRMQRGMSARQLEVPLSACRACSATTLALRLLVVVAEAVAWDAKRLARLGLKVTCKSHKAKHLSCAEWQSKTQNLDGVYPQRRPCTAPRRSLWH